MKLQLMASVALAAVVLLLATLGADALPSTISSLHPAPAPLLAAGIPAFAALGGGVAVRQLWRKFTRGQ
jgi:hypothetical protein